MNVNNEGMAQCPKCRRWSLQYTGDNYKCRKCRWYGDVYDCHPKDIDDGPAEIARLEDAVCANHPGKKAIAVCAGTGDYICSLCRVELNGKDYSVQYLDRGGKAIADVSFARHLPRPDKVVTTLALLSLWIGFLSPIFIIVSTVFFRRAARLRRENDLYRDAAPWRRVKLAWGVNLLVAVACVVFITIAVVAS